MATETTVQGTTRYRPKPVRQGDDRFVSLAAQIGEECAPRAARYDRENSFAAEDFGLLRESGYTKLGVPAELGGLGASLRQAAYAQAELAKHAASTALAVNMHVYLSFVVNYRWRHGLPGAEATLRRVASEGLILMTSGASDGIWPTATATRVEGGYRVNGRKSFCSQAPVAGVLITSAVFEDPGEGTSVLMLSIPAKSEGFEIVENWDTLGMRATSSHDVQLNDVFVADSMVAGRRPWGKVDPTLRTAIVHFEPLAAATYYGIAAGARDEAVRVVQQRRRGDGQPLVHDPSIQRQVGEMDQSLRASWWTILGALDEVGEDYAPDEPTADVVQTAKARVVNAAIQVVDLAMEVVGGSAYFKRSKLEMAYRDVRAGRFHPFTTEKSLAYTGRLALGLPVDSIW